MYTSLLKKEILDYLVSIRFVVLTALCVLLIPLSFYVNFETYRRWSADYNEELKAQAALSGGSRDEYGGIRQPSPLSVFANGIETSLPKDFAFSHQDNRIVFGTARSYGDPIYEIFGKIDFMFVVQTVLSLVALLFAFDSISGEKESGTLKLCFANPLPRYRILLGKFVGGMLVLVAPFLLSFGIGLAILAVSGYPVFAGEILSRIVLLLGLAVIYMGVFFLLGLLLSTLTHQSKTSLIMLMLLWVVLVLAVPRLSVMAAKVILPVDDDSVVLMREQLLTDSIQKEKGNALKQLFFEKARQKGMSQRYLFDSDDPEFMKKRNEIAQPFEARLRAEVSKLEENQQRKKQAQLDLARSLSRLSPAAILSYLMTDVADTGEDVKIRFLDLARMQYATIDRLIFSKMYVDRITEEHGSWGFSGNIRGNDRPKELPRFSMTFPRTAVTLAGRLPDMGLMFGYAVLIFAATTVAFLKYDVR
jgi:ABC-type transport system involved in multi-copper enzyme maturation permease subunit